MPPDMPNVAVVIAYYQREPGLLALAVNSILSQFSGPLQIIIVDDGSPRPAISELTELPDDKLRQVQIIHQPNAGPGAARNRGLMALSDTIDFVAFLDSDDQWMPDHMARALRAFDLGADFYFTDYQPLYAENSAFFLSNLNTNNPVHQPQDEDIFLYGSTLFDALLRRAPVGTSTVVFRRNLLGSHRFPEDFSYGEDVFFWMLITGSGCRVMFSNQPGAIYGGGVNIAAGAGWGTPSSLKRLSSEMRLHKTIAKHFTLDDSQSRWSKLWCAEVSRSFITSLLHLIRHRKTVDWKTVRRFMTDQAANSIIFRIHL
jgi:succinoglycan biosynthesis protein ExoW